MIELELPYPPSLNRYYRHVGAKVLISREGRAYRERVMSLVRGSETVRKDAVCTIVVHPPDRRRRDLDNVLKALLDALVHGGVLADDSLVKELRVSMGCVAAGGAVEVSVREA